MRMELNLIYCLECSICKQNMFSENMTRDNIIATLCGAKKYAVCPNCGQEVKKVDWTKEYKRKYIARVKKILNK